MLVLAMLVASAARRAVPKFVPPPKRFVQENEAHVIDIEFTPCTAVNANRTCTPDMKAPSSAGRPTVSDPRSPSSKLPLALVFDLGGVLIDIDFDRAFKSWQPWSRLSIEEMRVRFRFDDHYERHERGEISAGAYYDHLGASLQIEGDHEHLAAGWNSIFSGEIGHTMALVRSLRGRVPCYVFSNTNAAHALTWLRMFPSVEASFDGIFTSHEMGMRKPERRAFEHVAMSIDVAPECIMFFDDRIENVQGAAAAGFQAVHVASPADVRNALIASGWG